jgi:hypothetical protein
VQRTAAPELVVERPHEPTCACFAIAYRLALGGSLTGDRRDHRELGCVAVEDSGRVARTVLWEAVDVHVDDLLRELRSRSRNSP